MKIRVECYSGHRGEETPQRFLLGDRPVVVKDVIDRWLAPDHRYFKIRGDDDAIYILRHDVEAGDWELTMLDRLPPDRDVDAGSGRRGGSGGRARSS
jgi:hypothetical protein